jgi:hypothetical protein
MPYRPASHNPVQEGETRPVEDPYLPTGQLLQAAAPDVLYFPVTQDPEQDALVSPDVAPKVPAGHALHMPAPAREYCPATHIAAVGDTLPVTHT